MASESPTLYQIESRLLTRPHDARTGPDAHRRLAPRPRHGWEPGVVPEGARRAAVLVLLYPLDDAPHVLLTVRSGRLPTHAGQVALPGGVVEPSEAVHDAALREAHEEVGLDRARVRVVATLSTLHIPASDFAIHPVVAIADLTPTLRRSEAEVRRVVQVPLAELADPRNLWRGTRWRRDRSYEVPFFELRHERVWGATAMILAELLAVLGLGPRDPW